MELFKSAELKKEFKDFSNNILPKVLECGYCNIRTCMWHSKFDITCLHCRQRQCKNCKMFNISKDILLKSASAESIDYLYNYICDFLNISDESINCFFPEIKVEKREIVNYKKKVKSEKNRTQVVNCKLPTTVRSGTYQNGRWKRRFFY